jgi:hypothetical protein
MPSSPARSVLTQNTPLALTNGAELLRRLRQTSSVGGWSETDATAVAVKPVCPAAPALVTTWTAAPSRLIASRKAAASTLLSASGPIASKAPAMASSGR